ncbi:MAG TPA: hypothetical protein VMF58_07055 [Rhizomicrobium sp.]|nr:hypothetical protein [Rhizomicrobium sp.]
MCYRDPNDYRDNYGNLTRDAITTYATDVARCGQPLHQSVQNLTYTERQYVQTDYNYATSNRGW